eukprot:gb/GECG01005122.1/.p1 GENE.gb/GECG01005122.1/~~gb/GECG01005122.1/.p1  ORF type:complete len:548 (+),score=122.28 gb/GECG01005122.1/:1-1644(+)
MSSIDEKFQQAQQKFAQKQFEEAYDIFMDILPEIDASNKEAKAAIYANMGAALLNLNKSDEALEYYDKALKADPSNVSAQHNKALALREKGDLEGAAAGFHSVVEQEPENLAAVRGLVSVYLRNEQNELADEWSKKAYDLAPINPHVVTDRATTLIRNDNPKDALELLQPLVDEGEADDHLLKVYSFAASDTALELQNEEKYEEALETINIALKHGKSAVRLFRRGIINMKLDRLADAVSDLQEVVQDDPSKIEAQSALGALLMQLERYEEAIEPLKIAATNPKLEQEDRLEAVYNAGFALYKVGRYEEAIEQFQSVLDENPEHENAENALTSAKHALRKQNKEGGDSSSSPSPSTPTAPESQKQGVAASKGAQQKQPSDQPKESDRATNKGSEMNQTATAPKAEPSVKPSQAAEKEKEKGGKEKGQAATGEKPKPKFGGGSKTYAVSGNTSDLKTRAVSTGARGGAASFTINGEPFEPKDEDGVNGKVYPKSDLEAKPFPEDVDPKMREAYLSLEEFREVFGMSKVEFYSLPKWKRIDLRKLKKMF